MGILPSFRISEDRHASLGMGRKLIHTVHSVDEDDSRRIQGRRDGPLFLSRQGPVMWADIKAGVETIIKVGSVIAIIGENKEARNVWKELKLRKIQRIIHQTLHRAWRKPSPAPRSMSPTPAQASSPSS